MNFALANLHHPRSDMRLKARRYLSVHSDLLASVVAARIDRISTKQERKAECAAKFRATGECHG